MKTQKKLCIVTLLILGGMSKINAQTWNLVGNSGTNPATNFIGTTDNQNLIFRRNNVKSGLISSTNTSFGFDTFSNASFNPDASPFYNSAFGALALKNITNGNGGYNTAIGYSSLTANTGNFNTAIGCETLKSNIAGTGNVALGFRTLMLNSSGGSNIGIGYQSMYNTTGNNNIALGYMAYASNTTSSLNGSYNIAIGRESLRFNSNGSGNVALGDTAGWYNSGSSNVFIGNSTGNQSSATNVGDYNVAVGERAGNLLNGNYNILLGYQSNVRGGNNHFYLNIGEAIFGKNLLGRDSATGDWNTGAPARIGIRQNNPGNTLDILSPTAGTSGLRFSNLNSSSTPVASNGRVLSLNASGDVVLTTDQGSGGSTLIQAGTNVTVTGTGVTGNPYVISSTATNCNLYSCDGNLTTTTGLRTVTMGNNNLFFQTNPAFDSYGRVYIGASSNNFTPITATSRYRLFVEGGILTERVKVATNGTVNWADYVFADDYKLAPLSDVEKFIKKNNHLPGIESAETLSKDGLDLGDMQAKQMAKIEELTLYVIQQNKEIEELKAQMKALLERK
ncbi:MAG: hypothetical protein JNJ52_11970 [Flavobacterium sp.]|nr:hypothetical protein [Flavobacterium sp.]